MLLRRRGKKLASHGLPLAARCVAPRLRPCWANRCGPKISDRMGACTGPRAPSSMWHNAWGAPGTRWSSQFCAITYRISAPAPINIASTKRLVTKRADTKPFTTSAAQRTANRRRWAFLQCSRCSPNADNSIGEVSAGSLRDAVVHRALENFLPDMPDCTFGETVGVNEKQTLQSRCVDGQAIDAGCLSDEVPSDLGKACWNAPLHGLFVR